MKFSPFRFSVIAIYTLVPTLAAGDIVVMTAAHRRRTLS
jgi:hypothetical protein